MLKNFYLLLTLWICMTASAHAQQKWNLLTCVQYAMQNNISVKQSALQITLSDIKLKQSRLSQYPNANYSNNLGYSFGHTVNPSKGTLETQNFLTFGVGFQTSVQIFNWFSKKNLILANQWDVEAAKASTDKLKNDIALTVANAYLQVLLAIEQANIAAVQLQQSQYQLGIVRKQVNAGALPELNASELEAQVATDSATVIAANGAITQNILVLKAYMNVDAALPFEVDNPPADQIPIEALADLQPQTVYEKALKNLPQSRVTDYQLKSAGKMVEAARGALYPTFTAYGNLNTNYVYFRKPSYELIFSGYSKIPGLQAVNGTTSYDIQQAVYTQGNRQGYITADPFGSQLNNNFGQSVGLSMAVPIFNGWSAKAQLARSKINVTSIQLQKDLDNQNIKQNIYQAYNSAVVALEKLNASKKAVEAAERSYEFSNKRFNVGVLGTFELITNQNNLFKARLEYAVNQYDYVFKMKVLEFYKGEGLKL